MNGMTTNNGCTTHGKLIPHYVRVRAGNLKPGDVFIYVNMSQDGYEAYLRRNGQPAKRRKYKYSNHEAVVLNNRLHPASPYAKLSVNISTLNLKNLYTCRSYLTSTMVWMRIGYKHSVKDRRLQERLSYLKGTIRCRN